MPKKKAKIYRKFSLFYQHKFSSNPLFTANLNIVVKYDFVEKDGHWTIPSYKDHYKMDRAQFKFTNLFNGNKELGETCYSITHKWEAPRATSTLRQTDQIR